MGIGIDAESMKEPRSTPHGPSGMRKCWVHCVSLRKRDFRRSTFPLVAVALRYMPPRSMPFISMFRCAAGASNPSRARRAMFRFAFQQIERMGQHRQRGQQGTGCPGRTPRHIQHNGLAENSADTSTQHSERCLLSALSAHQLRDALQQPIAYRPRRFRGYIPCSDPGPSGSNHQTGHARRLSDCVFDHSLLVWNRNAVDRFKATCVQRTSKGGTREVFPLASRAAIAHGDDGCTPARG